MIKKTHNYRKEIVKSLDGIEYKYARKNDDWEYQETAEGREVVKQGSYSVYMTPSQHAGSFFEKKMNERVQDIATIIESGKQGKELADEIRKRR